jgi:membrane-associated phospholipid phosphatase
MSFWQTKCVQNQGADPGQARMTVVTMDYVFSKKFLLLISILIFILFILFSYLVAKETFNQIDFDITVKLQDRISDRWDYPFSIFSVLGQAEITGLIWLGLFIFVLIKRWWLTALTLPAFFLALMVELFGKVMVHHPSPPFLFYRGVIHVNFPTHFVHSDYSYPSGHMLRTAFLVGFIFLLLHFKFPKWFSIWVQLGLLGFLGVMFISRIYLGEHWMSDVIGGLLVGLSFGLLSGLTIPQKQKTQPELV